MTDADTESVVTPSQIAAFDLVAIQVWIFDRATGELLAANDAACRAFGGAREELLALRFPDLWARADRSAVEAALNDVKNAEYPAGPWRLMGNAGRAGLRWRAVRYEGRDAVLAYRDDTAPGTDVGEDARHSAAAQNRREDAPDLAQAHSKVEDQAALVRMAERLLGLGAWSYSFASRRLTWSDRVCDLYGWPSDLPAPDLDGYVALVHPDDRDRMLRNFLDFESSESSTLVFEHRIVLGDGTTIHVKGVGERSASDGHGDVIGYVQDVSEYVAAVERLFAATQLMRIAGEAAKLGGWRFDRGKEKIHWTPEIAAIHEEPEGFSPTLDQAIAYYAPEHRERVATKVRDCIERGVPFDDVFELDTAKGNRIRVRAIGQPVRDEAGEVVAIHGAFQDITDLVETRERLAMRSRQLRETVENMGDAFFILDDDWQFMFVNKQAEVLLERGRDDLIGQGVWDLFPEAKGTSFQRQYQKVRETRVTARFVEHFPPLRKWFRVAAYPVPEGVAVYFQDITEEYAREEHLRLLETAVARLGDIVLITEASPIDAPDGPRVVYANETFERITGFAREEIVGRTPRILQGPDTDRATLDRIRVALERREPVRAELVNYTKSGVPYWLDIDIVPLADESGQHTQFVAVERDVTERKRAEEEIRSRDERFALVSRATNDVIWDWDAGSGTLWWSERLADVFGHDPETFAPGLESWSDQVHPDDREEVVQSLMEVLASSEANWSREYRFFRADGQPRIVQDRGFVIRDEQGQALRMLGSMVDLTEQRALEARYRQAQKLEAVGHLTGGVAHDFNNLLTVILGNAEILSEELTDPGERQMAEMIARASERGAELTGRLLAYSRQQALAPQRIDLNRNLVDMRALLRRTLREDIDIVFDPAPDLWLADVDPAQFESAILNLAINARDAMPSGGRLTIETTNSVLEEDHVARRAEIEAGEYVCVAVSDSGSGMSRDVLDQAFEPFFTTKEVGVGSGLGLSMVYGFVKQSGGHVTLYSELDHGTTARLYFPRAESAAPPADRSLRPSMARGGHESILVVEDDDLVRSHLLSQLRALGYQVESAANGPEALAALERGASPDLLLTDVMMPGGMNGRELADRTRALRPGIRVLYSSGYTENAIIHHGRLDEGAQLLEKPYRRDDLARKVRLVLDSA